MKRLFFCLAFVLGAGSALAQAPGPQVPVQLDQLKRADGARLVPERFLQPWDPITLFFDRDLGPANGGPEDHPERVVKMTPEQAGAWQWLGARALQFRPAEPSQPLKRVEIAAEGSTTRLVPLLPAPAKTSPESRPDGIADLDQIALTFSEPVDVAALSRLLTIELRPLPGISGREGQVLTGQDFQIKALERAKRADQETYLVGLREPVPDGRLVLVRLRLSDEPGLDDPSFELQLRTAVPFEITELTCGRRLRRDLQDGVLRCAPVVSTDSDDEEGEGKKYQPGVKRTLALGFTGEPEGLDVVRAREALRITPPVDDLAVEKDGARLRLSGRFKADTAYELRVAPGAVKDGRGRPLEGQPFAQRFAFTADKPSLVWDANQGIVERFGPQMVPLRGRGYERADVRIHAIDPMSRDFWPFPAKGLETDDADAPPLPGNEPQRWADKGDIAADAMMQRIKALGSPAVSELVSLPTQRGGLEAKFGLDLRPLLAKIAGPEQAGTYLVGLKPVDGGKRRWLRVQVTDLTLSVIEEAERVRFAVTSLASAAPVADAEIRLEGLREDKFVTLARGTTDKDGAFTWSLAKRAEAEIKRIVVTKGADALVLEPDRGPTQYSDENWTKPEEAWLAWTVNPEEKRAEEAKTLCHVFTERPIYRPEEPVHIKGFVRRYLGGSLSYATAGGTVLVSGPSDQEWRFPIKLDRVGGFYHKFDAETPATGDYTVKFEPEGGEACGDFPFKKEAYRLPTFEVLLNSPQRVPLDGEFSVDLLARYFSGGLVAGRPVKWRVTQFPYSWTPPGREGFLFSTDARYSGEGKFRSTPVLERETKTDDGGSARLTLDPTVEPTAQPRRYNVEATVTGDDDIQVRSIQSVTALPPFVIGVKMPRYLPDATTIEPELLALNAAGEPLAGAERTVRLIKRNWTSVLQASDFSQGSAKYVTEVIDETLAERKVTSTQDVQRLVF